MEAETEFAGPGCASQGFGDAVPEIERTVAIAVQVRGDAKRHGELHALAHQNGTPERKAVKPREKNPIKSMT